MVTWIGIVIYTKYQERSLCGDRLKEFMYNWGRFDAYFFLPATVIFDHLISVTDL